MVSRCSDSEYRQSPPPSPRRCSDSNMLGEDGVNSNASMVRPYSFTSCKRVMSTTIESLTDELLSHILVRLPADYLHDRARLVCRRWYHIIHSHAFVKTQVQHSSYGLLLPPDFWTLLFPESDPSQSSRHPCLLSATTQGQIETSEFDYECRTIVGSCNGLVLECNPKSVLPFIINPATKQVFHLTSCPGGYYEAYTSCIAYAAASGVYKVTLPHRVRGQSLTKLSLLILTVGVDTSWRDLPVETLPQRARRLFCDSSLSTEGGFIHWTKIGPSIGTLVLTLDVETEVFTMSEVPLCRSNKYKPKYYLSTGRYLSLLVATSVFVWQVWWMEPESREWRKLPLDINLKAEKCRLKQIGGVSDNQVLVPLGWVKYPEVLAMSFRRSTRPRTCIFYNLDTHEISSIELRAPLALSAFAHKKSLMWLA